MIIRKLNQHGMNEFSRFIIELRNGGKQNTPTGLLDSDESSVESEIQLELDEQIFESRYELGDYLLAKIDAEQAQLVIGDAGFWSALALYWFDQLCPPSADGTRKPSMPYNYVLSEDYKHRYRHSVFMTWQLVSAFGEDARFLLSKNLSVRGELIEQLMARQYYLGCEGVMRAASQIYFDNETKSFKKGSAGRTSPGCVSRFVIWLQQLEINYDLFTMNRDDLIQLMPKEFDRFKTDQ